MKMDAASTKKLFSEAACISRKSGRDERWNRNDMPALVAGPCVGLVARLLVHLAVCVVRQLVGRHREAGS